MARRTKAEAEATRESILEAAIEAFLERGVANTTLEQVARRAGVTRGAVYWHFQDKNDLFCALIDRVRLPMYELVEHLRELKDIDPLAVIHNICRHALMKLQDDEDHRRIYTILFSRCEFVCDTNPSVKRQNQLDAESIEEVRKDFELARTQGLLREGVEPRIAALSLFALIKGIYLTWLRDPGLFDLRKDGEPMLDLFFDGVRRPHQ